MSDQPLPATRQTSERLLIVMGALWLLLALVALASEYVRAPSIKISWVTETETETAGFFVNRSLALPEGTCSLQPADYTRLNDTIIPSQGSATSGARYSYVDRHVTTGQVYCYQLEDVELSNTRTLHDPITGRHTSVRWWVIFAAAFSVVMGFYLIVSGLRQSKPL